MRFSLSSKEFILGSVAILFGLIAIGTLAWVLIAYPSEQFPGERFVLHRISFFNNLTPISVITFSAFICFACSLEIFRSRLIRLQASLKILLFIFFCFWAFVYAYEVLWQFAAWTEAYILSGGNTYVDQLHVLPNQETGGLAHNFTFRTKYVFFLVALSLYGAYFLNGIMRTESDEKKKNSKKP